MFGSGSKKKKKEKRKALEVKSRSKSLRAVRLRLAWNALAISTGMVLALLVVWKGGEELLRRYVYTSPSFALENLEVITDGIIPAGQIQRWAGVERGENVLSLDLARLKRNLEMVPLIEQAFVERHLPRSLIIRVTEREPIAKVVVFQPRASDGMLAPSAFYLDHEGMVIPPYARTLNPRAFDEAIRWLPALTGVLAEELRAGHKVARPAVLQALQWIRQFRGSDMAARVSVASVHISAAGTLEVHTTQGNTVTFRNRDFGAQFARWRKVHDYALGQSKLIAKLDLAVTNYVPASWLELTNAPPAAMPPTTESPYRKKHV